MNKATYRAAVLLLIMQQAGCGFHLRGSNIDPAHQISQVFLNDRGAASIGAELRKHFEDYSVQVVDAPQKAQAVITVTNERSDERVLSVDPRTGKAREYELGYHVTFQIQRPGDGSVVPTQNIDLTRDFTFDEAAALSKFEEAKVVRDEMKRDAVDSILRRVESIRP